MMKTLCVWICALILGFQLSNARGQGTIFTYQGRLSDGPGLASGSYDLYFGLFDAASGGLRLGSVVTNAATEVSNGLFTVTLDFGDQFSGADRWLEIAVGTNGASTLTTLAPRQRIGATPYAITAGKVTGAVAAAQIGGTVSWTQLPTGLVTNNASNVALSGAFSGDGANLTNVSAASLGGISAGGFWQLGGNNVLPGQFLGSTNQQPVEVWSGGNRVAHFEAISNDVNHSSIANVINGSAINSMNAGAVGVTIAGGGAGNYYGSGGPNRTMAPSDFSTIGGGWKNLAYRQWATIAGGDNNTAGGDYSSIGGGTRNFGIGTGSSIGGGGANTNIGFFAVISGGTGNTIPNPGNYNSIGGGLSNTNSGMSATVAGGQYNLASGYGSVIAGGEYNVVTAMDASISGGAHNQATMNGAGIGGGQHNIAAGPDSAIGGGYNNSAQGESAAVGGGWFNFAGTNYATVPGGQNNAATGDSSFAAGQYAYAAHAGTFVWADGSVPGTAFASTGSNQFLVRARGGVGINTNNPNGAALNVNGIVAATGFAGDGSSLSNLNASSLAGGTVPVSALSGITSNQLEVATWRAATNRNGGYAQLATNLVAGVSITNAFVTNSVFAGNGAGLTNVDAATLNGASASAFAPAGGSTGYIQNQSASPQPASLSISGSAQITGLIRSGSESGSTDLPAPAGLVIRRVNSLNAGVGNIVARTDVLTLERDGSNAGLLLRYPAAVPAQTINCVGQSYYGTNIFARATLNNPAGGGTIQLLTSGQRAVHAEISFGNTYNGGQLTKVSLDRYDDGAISDNYWVGTVTSTFNQ